MSLFPSKKKAPPAEVSRGKEPVAVTAPEPRIEANLNPVPPVIIGAHSNAAMHVGDLKPTRRRSRLVNVFLPNRAVPVSTMWGVALVEAALFIALWLVSPFKILPRPLEVLRGLQYLWMEQGLGQSLANSFQLNLVALATASVISLALAYSTVVPIFRPLVAAVSKGRFLSSVGFSLVAILLVGGGFPEQLVLLTFAITVFYVTSMAAVIAAIPYAEFEHARTIRMSEWRVVWEVVVLGTADKAFEVLRQNAAMGWMMLTFVEGTVRAGGVGEMLLNVGKHSRYDWVFAIQLLVLTVGLLQDTFISFLRLQVCPYANLTTDHR